MAENYVPNNKKKVVRKSSLPFYAAAATYVICMMLFPLHTLIGFVIAGALAAGAFAIAEKNAPTTEEYVDKTEKELTTGDEATDALLKRGRSDIEALRKYNSKLPDPDITEKLNKITTTGDKILDYVHDHPKSASKVRQFLNYFLPTTKKLMDNYMLLTAQSASGENIDTTKAKIESMLGQIGVAFDKQLDALFADTKVDVSADISVMQNLMNERGFNSYDSASSEKGEGIELQL